MLFPFFRGTAMTRAMVQKLFYWLKQKFENGMIRVFCRQQFRQICFGTAKELFIQKKLLDSIKR